MENQTAEATIEKPVEDTTPVEETTPEPTKSKAELDAEYWKAEAKKAFDERANLKKKLTAKEQEALEESGKIKEAYDMLKDTTKDYDELKAFKEQQLQKQSEEVSNLAGQLTESESKTYDLIKDSLPIDKQRDFLNNIISNRKTGIVVDASKGGVMGNKFDKTPTKEELIKNYALAKEFKDKHPAEYRKIMDG